MMVETMNEGKDKYKLVKSKEIKKGDYIKLDTGEVGQVTNISSDHEIVDIKLNNGEFETVRYSEIQIFD